MSVIARLLTTFLCTCLSLAAHGEKLRIVTEPWAPYVYEENGTAKGPVSYTHLRGPRD